MESYGNNVPLLNISSFLLETKKSGNCRINPDDVQN